MNNKIFSDNLIFVWIIIFILNIALINSRIIDIKKDLKEIKEIIQRESDIDE